MASADPGWGRAVRGLWRALIPFMRPSKRLDGLGALRFLYLSFLVALGIFFGILPLVAEEGPAPRAWMFVLVIAAGIVGIVVAMGARGRRLATDDLSSLAGSYRSHMFLGIAFSESSALFGFVGTMISGRLLLYAIGFSFAVVGMLVVAPSRAHIARRQAELTAAGSTLDLVQALKETPARNPRTL